MVDRTSLGGFAPRNRSRVSEREPSTGSTTVRTRTPFNKPILRNIVSRFLSTEVSNISVRQIEVGGAVNAYSDQLGNGSNKGGAPED